MITVLKEKAGRSIRQAVEIRDSLAGVAVWPAEKQTAFDAHMKDYGTAVKELQAAEAQAATLETLRAGEEMFLQAAPSSTLPGVTPKVGETMNADTLKKTHREAFNAYLRGGDSQLMGFATKTASPKEILALLSTDATLGGFTVPEDFQAELLKALAGFTAIRPLARVQTTNRDSVLWPKLKRLATDSRRTSGFAGDFKGQGYVTGGTAPTTQNQPTFEQERIPVHAWRPDAVEISPELLEDSAVSIDMVLSELIAETLAFDEDDKFLNGTGVNEPEGILQAGLTSVNTGASGAFTYGGLVNLYTGLPAQYRSTATFMMNSNSYGKILQLEDSDGRLIYVPNQLMPTLWGRPIAFHEQMADVAASSKSIIFGAFRYYMIVERAGLRIQRLTERYAPNVGFLPSARIGGQCIQLDAFRTSNTSS